MRLTRLVVLAVAFAACARSGPSGASGSNIKVGPPDGGAVVVVGGGALGPEIYKRFIELAGGPDKLILAIPTAGGAPTYTDVTGTRAQFEQAGAKNVKVLHTYDRKVAESDTFVAYIKRAGGVWFDGGRQYRLADSYGGTKSEAAFHDVLKRGGVVGGSSAGASILGSYMVRGAPSNDNGIMAHAEYGPKGFGFLRNTGIDQHVVARYRLPDIADSLMPRYPNLFYISEDEGTAWVIQGDDAEIIGRNKAFAYNGRENDPGKPFLTLRPGDRYNVADRRVVSRAADGTPLAGGSVDALFEGTAPVTVLVARDGKVLVNKSFNVPPQRRFTPTTAMPQFAIGNMAAALNGAIVSWLVNEKRATLDDLVEDGSSVSLRQHFDGSWSADGERKVTSLIAKKGGATYAQMVQRRLRGPAGLQRTENDTLSGSFSSNVDDLYRLEMSVLAGSTGLGWKSDTYSGQRRVAAYVTPDRKRGAFVRFPDSKVAIIILSDSDAIDAGGIADQVARKLFGGP